MGCEGFIRLIRKVLPWSTTCSFDKCAVVIKYWNGALWRNAQNSAAYNLALVYAELGPQNAAIELVQKCLEARDDRLVWIKIEPRYASLRSDARFQEILRRMNLPVNTT